MLRLLNIRDYEDCKSCETLKEQLRLANIEKKELTETMLGLIAPKQNIQSALVIPPVTQTRQPFTHRRPGLEKQFETRRDVRERSPFIVQDKANSVKDISPESVEEMERKLNLAENDGQKA